MTKQEFLDETGLARVFEKVNSLFTSHKINHVPNVIHTDSINNELTAQKEGEIWTFDY